MEVDSLCRYLASQEINLTSNNKWLNECVRWFKSNPNLMVKYGSLQDYVILQWLLADLQDIRNSCLPIVNDDRSMVLPGKYAVQINWMRDIGQSCYSQYRSIQSKDAILNEEVSAEESKKQSWEPNPKRVLMMEITDGVNTMKAMEFGAIPKLGAGFLPGMKMIIKGPIECRRKILFLKNCNVDIFGGEVDSLYEVNRVENLLSRCLNLPPLRPNPTSTQDGTSTTTAHNQNINASTRPNSNLRNNSSIANRPNTGFQTNASLPGTIQSNGSVSSNSHYRAPAPSDPPRSVFNKVQRTGNGQMDISDEDDDLFNQLPDDLLKDKDCGDRRLSPVLDDVSDVSSKPSSPQPGPSFAFQVPSSNSSSITQRSLAINKHKRFPSLEDFSTEEKVDSSLNRPFKKQSTLSNFVLQKTPASISAKAVGNSSKYFSPVTPSFQSPTVISDSTGTSPYDSPKSPIVHPFIPSSSSTCFKNVGKKSVVPEFNVQRQPWDDSQSLESNYTSNVSSRNGSDYTRVKGSSLEDLEPKEDEDVFEIVDSPEKTYPVVRKQQCKVNELLKVKVKERKWVCEADAIIEGKSTKVQFSNEVLTEVIGVDATHMEALRNELPKDPSIKQKMNVIWTAGRKKLKTLNCLVTVEYFDDDSLPKITSVNNR